MPPRARPIRLALSFALAVALLLLLYRRRSEAGAPHPPSHIPDSTSESSAHPSPLTDIITDTLDQSRADELAAAAYAGSLEGENARRKALHEAKVAANAMSKRVIVASVKGEDTSWTTTELPEGWEAKVYIADSSGGDNALHPPLPNKGREAGVFLWYLFSEYDNLAETNVFLHAHRAGYPAAWHVDNEIYSNPLSVRRLRLETVQKKGFVNLRCLPNPGCPDDVQPFRDPPDPKLKHERAMADAWRKMFSDQKVPQTLAAPCCSQFAVSKKQIRRRKKEEYERFYKWIKNTELEDAVSGRVLEYLWHVIFGQAPIFCPEVFDCRCDVYGDGCLDGLDLGLKKVKNT